MVKRALRSGLLALCSRAFLRVCSGVKFSRVGPAVSILMWWLAAVPVWAADSSVHTFTSPDGTFSLEYRDPLIACKKVAESWETIESCACEDSDMACIAYPTRVAGTSFVSGVFPVGEITGARDRAGCLNGMPLPDYPTPASREIHGMSFKAVHRDGVAGGTAQETYQYWVFHGGKCYELNVHTRSMNPEIADPGAIKQMPESKRREIGPTLERTLDSFRFLK